MSGKGREPKGREEKSVQRELKTAEQIVERILSLFFFSQSVFLDAFFGVSLLLEGPVNRHNCRYNEDCAVPDIVGLVDKCIGIN